MSLGTDFLEWSLWISTSLPRRGSREVRHVLMVCSTFELSRFQLRSVLPEAITLTLCHKHPKAHPLCRWIQMWCCKIIIHSGESQCSSSQGHFKESPQILVYVLKLPFVISSGNMLEVTLHVVQSSHSLTFLLYLGWVTSDFKHYQ